MSIGTRIQGDKQGVLLPAYFSDFSEKLTVPWLEKLNHKDHQCHRISSACRKSEVCAWILAAIWWKIARSQSDDQHIEQSCDWAMQEVTSFGLGSPWNS